MTTPPTTVAENDNITILYDMLIPTDRSISANRLDIIVKDKRDKICTLIDVAIPTDRNTSIKAVEKLSKCKDLEIEIERMWQTKTEVFQWL